MTNCQLTFFSYFISQGGPTRNFLSQLWSQLSNVTVLVQYNDGNSCDKRIFQDFGECVVPTLDVKAQIRGLPYYKAIGRIIAYCILNEETIANHILVSSIVCHVALSTCKRLSYLLLL